MNWMKTCPQCGREKAFNHSSGVCFQCSPPFSGTQAKDISEWNRDPLKPLWHPDTEDAFDCLRIERDRLAEENQELKDMEKCSHELFDAACNDLGDALEQLAALRDVVSATCRHSDPSEYFAGMNKCYDILHSDTGAPEGGPMG